MVHPVLVPVALIRLFWAFPAFQVIWYCYLAIFKFSSKLSATGDVVSHATEIIRIVRLSIERWVKAGHLER